MEYKEREIEIIKALSEAKGPSGFEDEVVDIAKNIMSDICDVKEDKVRNLYFYRKKNTGNKPILMLDAHSDEVGFMVHSIKPNGMIRVVNLGRWTNTTLPSAKVLVRNSEGKWIEGMFMNVPAHFAKATTQTNELPISALAIDIGSTSYEETVNKFKIRIGEPIVPATKFTFNKENGIMFSKAFDCRIGCAALLETIRRLEEFDLDVDVVGVLSAQEEVGERGCKVSVNTIKPDIAICYEGAPADDTFTEEYAIQTALRKGPMFRHIDVSAICSPRLQRFVLDLAYQKKMPVQESVREGGGNDAAVINTALQGIPVVTAGIPVRYIHSMNCISTYEDYEYTVNLIVEIVKNLNKNVIDKL